ncbi:sulfite exporter TauE/SafE family protein [Aurantiacibacter sp. MUD61]|uniref:sulfite exporter TauE/SafE family protein n=1 Tax=Aurantiacibacter sp. MUD61 TaxID=3009083 RepID=UPI0022F035F6|nr:sulfite exporter TauE/SafE family protein [Aurantiacibacter sp. MUD61]
MEILAGFSTTQIAAAAGATLLAAFVRGLTGFGFGILLVPILALALSPVEAVLLINIMAFLLALSEVRFVLREAARSAYVIAGLLALTTLPGLLLLDATPQPLARLLIAICALGAFAAVIIPKRKQPRPPAPLVTGLTGLSAGVLTGFAAMPGAPVIPYYVRQDLPRLTAKASMIGIFGVAALAGVASGTVTGLLEWRTLLFGLMLFPLVLLGNWVGSLAFGRISDPVWRAFVGIVLGAAAVAALLKL